MGDLSPTDGRHRFADHFNASFSSSSSFSFSTAHRLFSLLSIVSNISFHSIIIFNGRTRSRESLRFFVVVVFFPGTSQFFNASDKRTIRFVQRSTNTLAHFISQYLRIQCSMHSIMGALWCHPTH